MTQKRKVDDAFDEAWDVSGMRHCSEGSPSAYQNYASQTVRNELQASQGGYSDTTSDCTSTGLDDAASEQNGHSVSNTSTTGVKKLSKKESEKLLSMRCEWNMCSSVFNKPGVFIIHVADHLTTVTEPMNDEGYACEWRECDFVCSTKDEMDRHVFFHVFHEKIKGEGQLLMMKKNEKCMLDSSSRNVVPELPEPFQCLWTDCMVKFASALNFYSHVLGHVPCVADSGSDKKTFSCSWGDCSSTFPTRHNLKLHIRSHTQEKIVACPNCGLIYASNTKFMYHFDRQTPLESQQYQCSLCSRRYATETLLRDHVRHHVNHYKCSECDMTVTTKSALRTHIRYRHKKEKPHKCIQCGRRFTTLSDLARHLTCHSVEPAYSCLYEGCSFKSRAANALNKHIKLVHNGLEKNHYACHLCTKRFVLGFNLTKHLTKVHNFECPVGHIRFRYKQDEDGLYRLQTVRYESIELNQDTLSENEETKEEEEGLDPAKPSTVSSCQVVQT